MATIQYPAIRKGDKLQLSWTEDGLEHTVTAVADYEAVFDGAANIMGWYTVNGALIATSDETSTSYTLLERTTTWQDKLSAAGYTPTTEWLENSVPGSPDIYAVHEGTVVRRAAKGTDWMDSDITLGAFLANEAASMVVIHP